jgi:hypothetical protein
MPPRRVSNVAEQRSRPEITCDFLKGQAVALQATAFIRTVYIEQMIDTSRRLIERSTNSRGYSENFSRPRDHAHRAQGAFDVPHLIGREETVADARESLERGTKEMRVLARGPCHCANRASSRSTADAQSREPREVNKEAVEMRVLLTRLLFACGILHRLLRRASLTKRTSVPLLL